MVQQTVCLNKHVCIYITRCVSTLIFSSSCFATAIFIQKMCTHSIITIFITYLLHRKILNNNVKSAYSYKCLKFDYRSTSLTEVWDHFSFLVSFMFHSLLSKIKMPCLIRSYHMTYHITYNNDDDNHNNNNNNNSLTFHNLQTSEHLSDFLSITHMLKDDTQY